MSRPLLVLMFLIGAALATVVLTIGEVQIRPAAGMSVGSRVPQTNAVPPLTRVVPKQPAAVEESVMQAQPVRSVKKAGVIEGLYAGFLRTGLIGMVLGYGLAGGLSNLASVFGLIMQAALVAAISLRLWMWWQRRQEFATAGGPPLEGAGEVLGGAEESSPAATAGEAALSFGRGLAGAMTGITVKLIKFDYDDFERLLGEILHAYGAQDLSIVRARVTPDMFNTFSEQFERNASRGVINRVSNVRFLQGDVAESWREGDQDFASVMMRYSIINVGIERATGRVVEGSTSPVEVTEKWTFVRGRYGPWQLFAMQHD